MVLTEKMCIDSRLIQSKLRVTVFHCSNAIPDISLLEHTDIEFCEIKMPCSSIARGLFLLRAFEAGADAVIVLVCPEGQCCHFDGNIRANKRVEYVKKVLDDIGLSGRRLTVYGVQQQDIHSITRIKEELLDELSVLGPNPSAKYLKLGFKDHDSW